MTVLKYHDGTAWKALPSGGPSSVPMDTWHRVGAAGEPAFTNGWINALGDPFSPPGFRKDPLGKVQLRGSVSNGTLGFSAFTLPVGYRPPAGTRFPALGSQSAGSWAQVNVNADGTVVAWGDTAAQYISLDQIEFDTESVTAMPTGPKGDTGGNATVPMDAVHYVGGSGEPAFLNSWKNLDNDAAVPGTGTQRSATFRKDPLGRVNLGGVVKGGATGTAAFQLPAGYRPRSSVYCVTADSAGVSGVNVDAAGVVSLNTITGNVTAYGFLDGVEFDTETVTAMPTGPQGPAGPAGPLSAIDAFTRHAQRAVTGGGSISYIGSYLTWTSRFIFIGVGRATAINPSGYFDVTVPAVGTAVAVHAGAAARSWTASGVALGAWEALYYEPPLGLVSTSVPGNFHVVNYVADFTVPSHWLFIAAANGDSAPYARICTGHIVPAGLTVDSTRVTGDVTTAAMNAAISSAAGAKVGTITPGTRVAYALFASDGSRFAGSNMAVLSWHRTGGYIVGFSTPFSTYPAVTVTAYAGASGIGIGCVDPLQNYTGSQVGISTINNDTFANLPFSVIAVGA